MPTQIIIVLGAVALIFIIQSFIFIRQYRRSRPNSIIVVHGKIDASSMKSFKIVEKGNVFVWPVIQDDYRLDIDKYDFINHVSCVDEANKALNVRYEITSKPDRSKLQSFVEEFFGKDKQEIIAEVNKIIGRKISEQIGNKRISEENVKAISISLNARCTELLREIGFAEPTYINVFTPDIALKS